MPTFLALLAQTGWIIFEPYAHEPGGAMGILVRNVAVEPLGLLAIACITQWYVHVQSKWGEYIRRTESPFYHPTGAGYVMTVPPAPPSTPAFRRRAAAGRGAQRAATRGPRPPRRDGTAARTHKHTNSARARLSAVPKPAWMQRTRGRPCATAMGNTRRTGRHFLSRPKSVAPVRLTRTRHGFQFSCCMTKDQLADAPSCAPARELGVGVVGLVARAVRAAIHARSSRAGMRSTPGAASYAATRSTAPDAAARAPRRPPRPRPRPPSAASPSSARSSAAAARLGGPKSRIAPARDATSRSPCASGEWKCRSSGSRAAS